MKKFIIFWVAVCLAFFSSAAVFASAEEGAPRVYAADCTAAQGGYAYVDIKAENLSAVGSMEVYVYYDTSVFAYSSSSENGLNAGNLCDVADDKENGVVLLQSLSPGGMNGSGNLWRITFSVAKDAPAGQYTLGVAVGEVTSSALEPLEVGAGNGIITVTERPATVNTMYVYSSVGNAVYEGEQAEVKFYTNNAYGLAAADFEIEYNSSRLKLDGVSLGNSLMQAEGAIWSVNTDTAGYIKISYINLKGISGGVNPLITCSFTVVGNVQESVPVSLTVSGIYDGAQNAIKSDGATADVSTLYVPPVVTYPAVYISEYTGTDGRFEVQAIAEGATALAAGDFVITYDNTALECVSVEKSVAENIVFVNPDTANGEIRFSFINEDGISADMPMITITFDPLISSGKTQLGVSGSDLVDAEFNAVTVEYVAANVEITGHAWGEWTETKAPGCTEAGEEQRVCSNDPSHVETRPVEAQGHDLVHHEGQAATCTESGWAEYDTCSRCDYTTYKEIPAAGHVPGEPVRENEVAATCEEDGSYDETVYCSVCGEELTREEITVPATGHAWGEWEQTKAPTCTEAGEEQRVCGNDPSHIETRPVEAQGHDLVHHEGQAATCTESGWAEYDTCSRCDYTTYREIPAAGHVPGEPVRENEVAVTCEEDGSYDEAVYCAVCGEELTREEITVPATGHAWGEWTETKAPGCTESGEEQRVCSNDPSHIETRPVEAQGHDLVHHDGQVATCTESGWAEYDTCSRCDYTTYREIPATGHVPGEWIVDKPATCEEDGSRHKECTVCHEVLETGTISATGHAWGEWTETKAPGCTESGEEQKVCSNDPSHIETRPVEALGHDLVHHEGQAATCTESGWAEYDTCSRCDYTTYKEIPAAGHVPGEPVRENEVAATCEEDGSYDEVVYCAVCGEELTREEITVPATGHAWGEWTETKAPGCTEAGEEQRVCSNDSSHIETRPVEALGHDLVHHEGQAATCTESGWAEYDTCSRCDYTTYKEIPAAGHVPGEPVRENEVAATCEDTGSYDETVYCAVCGEELSREEITVPATGHAWGEWTETKAPGCTEAGEEQRVCSNDPSHVETRPVEALGHDLVHHEGQAATCTESGWAEYDTCSRCDYTTYKEIPAAGHVPGEPVRENEVAATCEDTGSYDETVYCAVCGEELTREEITVPATGHAWGEWTESKAPTYTEEGEETRICSACGETDTRPTAALGRIQKFKDEVVSVGKAQSRSEQFDAISASLTTYDSLSEEEKAAVANDYALLVAAIEAYNASAEAANTELNGATEIAVKVLSSVVAIAAVLASAWFVLKRLF